MKVRQENTSLARWMGPLAPQVGVNASPLPGVRFQRFTRPLERSPAVYKPSIKIVAQGSILGHLAQESFRYDAENYLVLAAPLPVECELEASLAEPLVFMSIDLDWTTIGGLLVDLGQDADVAGPVPRAICASPLTVELRAVTVRLLRCLHSPVDARVLGPAIVREIFYRVLLGEQGEMLRAAVAHHSGFARVARALRLIHRDYAKCQTVETLARAAGMSVPAFHRHFRAVTASTPQRYLQAIRLHKARSLMKHGGLGAAAASAEVGYVSASQFSREFRRLFGNSPNADTKTAAHM